MEMILSKFMRTRKVNRVEAEQLLASCGAATLPWKSIDAMANTPPDKRSSEELFWKSLGKSDKREIERCMNCRKDECTNCISYEKRGKRRHGSW